MGNLQDSHCRADRTPSAVVAPLPARVELTETGSPQRAEYERFIQDVFARTYQARVSHFMPCLMGLRGANGALLAALGIRPAADGPLFLEAYLDQPAEAALSAVLAPFGAGVARTQVAEIGNLAAAHAGGSRWLIVALTAYLQGAGYDWTVFTALPGLRNAFRRLGIRLVALGPALRARLPEAEQADWGRYYEGGPQVVAANVPHTYGVLEKCLRLEAAVQMLHDVWHGAYCAGASRLGPAAPRPGASYRPVLPRQAG